MLLDAQLEHGGQRRRVGARVLAGRQRRCEQAERRLADGRTDCVGQHRQLLRQRAQERAEHGREAEQSARLRRAGVHVGNLEALELLARHLRHEQLGALEVGDGVRGARVVEAPVAGIQIEDAVAMADLRAPRELQNELVVAVGRQVAHGAVAPHAVRRRVDAEHAQRADVVGRQLGVERARGETLHAEVAEVGAVDAAPAVGSVAGALGVSVEMNLIHRDLRDGRTGPAVESTRAVGPASSGLTPAPRFAGRAGPRAAGPGAPTLGPVHTACRGSVVWTDLSRKRRAAPKVP